MEKDSLLMTSTISINQRQINTARAKQLSAQLHASTSIQAACQSMVDWLKAVTGNGALLILVDNLEGTYFSVASQEIFLSIFKVAANICLDSGQFEMFNDYSTDSRFDNVTVKDGAALRASSIMCAPITLDGGKGNAGVLMLSGNNFDEQQEILLQLSTIILGVKICSLNQHCVQLELFRYYNTSTPSQLNAFLSWEERFSATLPTVGELRKFVLSH